MIKSASELNNKIRNILINTYKDYNIKIKDKLGTHNIKNIDIDKDNNLIIVSDL